MLYLETSFYQVNLQYTFTHPLRHGQDVTQGQFFKQNKAGFNSVFLDWLHS